MTVKVALEKLLPLKLGVYFNTFRVLAFIKENTTIAGQSAPCDGIYLADYPLTIWEIITRYMCFICDGASIQWNIISELLIILITLRKAIPISRRWLWREQARVNKFFQKR